MRTKKAASKAWQRSAMPTLTDRDERTKNALEIYKAQLKAMGKKKGGSGAAASGAAIVNDDIGRALTLLQDDNEGFFTNLFQETYSRRQASVHTWQDCQTPTQKHCRTSCGPSRRTSHSTNSRPCEKPAQLAAHSARSAPLNCRT